MTWWAVDVRPRSADRDRLSAWLVAHTGQAVEERDDGTIVTFATDEDAAAQLAAEARNQAADVVTELRPLDDVDWSLRWRDGLGPRRIGRLTVAPSWAVPDAVDGPLVVLDPETAFGSGEHGSTRAALTLLERHVRDGDQVLDFGSGSGILAIAAVVLGARSATGIEIDDESNEVAARNAAANHVADRIRFLDGDAAVLGPLLGPADLVLSNILRSVNVLLLPAIRGSLRAGGLAIFAGMEAAEAELFRPELAAAGLDLVDETTDAGWWGVAARIR
jgi:ribosomal protein L11 methyltransferase